MNRQRKWASAALAAVRTYARRDGKPHAGEQEFRTLCMKGPALIQSAGLAQALAFLCSRDGLALDYVDAVAKAYGKNDGGSALLKQALGDGKTSSGEALGAYMALTRDVSAVAGWFRRFAQIELEAPGNETGTDAPQEAAEEVIDDPA